MCFHCMPSWCGQGELKITLQLCVLLFSTDVKLSVCAIKTYEGGVV